MRARRWPHTTVHVAVGNLTAPSTLALAFFAAMLADFQAVAELGWIAGCGVLLCALACFTVLPALLMLFDCRDECLAKPKAFAPDAALSASAVWLPGSLLGPAGSSPSVPWLVAVLAGFCRRGHLRSQPAAPAGERPGIGAVGDEADRAHGRGQPGTRSATPTRRRKRWRSKRDTRSAGVSRVVEVASLVPQEQNEKCRGWPTSSAACASCPSAGRSSRTRCRTCGR